MTSHGRSHRDWVKLKARAKEEMPWVCYLCGLPIDRWLPVNDVMGWTLDHIKSKQLYPELVHEWSNVAPAHRRCNSSKGKGQFKPGVVKKPKSSRVW